jgi:hypothetical protein
MVLASSECNIVAGEGLKESLKIELTSSTAKPTIRRGLFSAPKFACAAIAAAIWGDSAD